MRELFELVQCSYLDERIQHAQMFTIIGMRAIGDIDAYDTAGMTLLLYAINDKKPSIVGLLLNNGADANCPSRGKNIHPIVLATFKGQIDICEQLIKKNADVNLTKKHGTSALQLACSWNFGEIAYALLLAGADYNFCSSNNLECLVTPLVLAAQNGLVRELRYMLKDGNAKRRRSYFAINAAARRGHAESVFNLIKAGWKVDQIVDRNDDYHFLPPLFEAINQGHVLTAKILLDHNANIEEYVAAQPNLGKETGCPPDEIKVTPLWWAVFKRKYRIIDLLLERKANHKVKQTRTQNGLLHTTVIHNDIDLLERFTHLGCDVDSQNYWGLTSLYFATSKNHFESVSILLENGANTEIATDQGMTPIIIAAQQGALESLLLLIKANANVHHISRGKISGRTALLQASEKGHIAVVHELLKLKVDVNYRDPSGHSALDMAAIMGHTAIVSILVAHGADRLDIALYHACYQDHVRVAMVLIDQGVEISLSDQDKKYMFPIHAAVLNNSGTVFDLLLAYNRTCVDAGYQELRTAAEIAQLMKNNPYVFKCPACKDRPYQHFDNTLQLARFKKYEHFINRYENKVSEIMGTYLKRFIHQIPYNEQLEKIGLLASNENHYSQNIPDEYFDPITGKFMNKPVLLNKVIYDLLTIFQFKCHPENPGARQDPMNRQPFFMKDLCPAFELCLKIENYIKDKTINKTHCTQRLFKPHEQNESSIYNYIVTNMNDKKRKCLEIIDATIVKENQLDDTVVIEAHSDKLKRPIREILGIERKKITLMGEYKGKRLAMLKNNPFVTVENCEEKNKNLITFPNKYLLFVKKVVMGEMTHHLRPGRG